MWEEQLETNLATALGSARARRTSSGSGRWRLSARCTRRWLSPTSLATALCPCDRRVVAQRQQFRIVSFNAGDSLHLKDGQWQLILSLLSEMWESQLESRRLQYCSAGVSACEKNEQWQRSSALLSET
ncbi:unnamed protein product [Prorocentrum cordatum]|uniref:Uncharacterized protein n=1 Tax=Prorocentrum cordatum TaxID=2364126 RepID=A0ABN9UQU7_9DINO|nr:unnamed protein product [Polarella glacialis]